MKEIPFIPVEIFIEKIIKSYWENYDVNCIHVFINKKKKEKYFEIDVFSQMITNDSDRHL